MHTHIKKLRKTIIKNNKSREEKCMREIFSRVRDAFPINDFSEIFLCALKYFLSSSFVLFNNNDHKLSSAPSRMCVILLMKQKVLEKVKEKISRG
jgi:hypothetical protein